MPRIFKAKCDACRADNHFHCGRRAESTDPCCCKWPDKERVELGRRP